MGNRCLERETTETGEDGGKASIPANASQTHYISTEGNKPRFHELRIIDSIFLLEFWASSTEAIEMGEMEIENLNSRDQFGPDCITIMTSGDAIEVDEGFFVGPFLRRIDLRFPLKRSGYFDCPLL